MPTLQFKGKTAVETYHYTVPHHTLGFDPAASVLDAGQATPSLDGNLIIEGDNLLALKALLPTHTGRIKCIYIDPPYNTGNEGWVYNDNLTQPQFKEWIGEVVGKEGEDACRHDKWCCMMYPRLMLLKELLREDGVILVSIGDDEIENLVCLLNEVFDKTNQFGIYVWRSRAKPTNAGEAKFRPQKVAEYVLGYAKDASKIKFNPLYSGELRSYPHKDGERKYRLTTILSSNRGTYQRETMRFAVAGYTPSESQRWKGGEKFIKDLYDIGKIEFRNGTPFQRHYEDEEPDQHDPFYTFMPVEMTGTAEGGKTELNNILGDTHGFDTVKPAQLVGTFLKVLTNPEDTILDSFAGSGTTGQAVLELNKEDGGNRKFILVQQKHDSKDDEKKKLNICRTITAERVRRVIAGQGVPATGGGFTYARVSDAPLFGEYRDFGDAPPPYEDLAKYIFYTETSRQWDSVGMDKATGKIGAQGGTSYFLLYTPDGEANAALDLKWLGNVAASDPNARLVVYCEKFWMHRDELRRWEADAHKSVRAMIVPFQLK